LLAGIVTHNERETFLNNPYTGTWQLNLAKSKISPVFLVLVKMPAPKEKIYVIREVGDELELTLKGTGTDWATISSKEAFPLQGGVIKFEPSLP
jgi:hypothetical protein